MCDGDRLSRAVPVLGKNQVGLAATWVVTLECIGAVEQYDHVAILFQTAGFTQVR